jgi:uroporphyrinogen decarboxylase
MMSTQLMTPAPGQHSAEAASLLFKYQRAARGENLAVPPVWLMRQAGRYLPEFREIRKRNGFLDVCQTPELACEVTVQPIRRFGFDAAILFSDILVPLQPMGIKLWFAEGRGPQILNPIRTRADINALADFEPRESLSSVLTAVRMIRAELPPDVSLIGFAGAPFTLAAYMIEGGKPEPFAALKGMMYSDPESFHVLLQKLSRMVSDYTTAMVEAGADAIQIFDTWAGILTEREFRNVNLPRLQSIFQLLSPLDVPLTYYALGGMHLIPAIRDTGCTVASLDWRAEIPDARAILGRRIAVQGNLDPTVLLGSENVIRSEVRRILNDARGDGGYIFNLGHGILPATPISAVEIMIDEIRNPLP